jgi:hypothetical protein
VEAALTPGGETRGAASIKGVSDFWSMSEAAKTRFMVVVNHDREECCVHPIPNEENARRAVEGEKQKGRNITLSIFEAVDMSAARQRAESENENCHLMHEHYDCLR